MSSTEGIEQDILKLKREYGPNLAKGSKCKIVDFFFFISRVFEVKIFICPTLSGARIFVFEIPEATRIKFHHFTGI